MASRRRRRKPWWRRLRRGLIEHRFSATEGLLGLVALGVGLWLLWPGPQPSAVDHRGLWEQSVASLGQPAGEPGPEVRGGFEDRRISSARAGGSISAKRHLVGTFGAATGPLLLPPLARLGETMPEIGPPPTHARLPQHVRTPDGAEIAFPIEEGVTLPIVPEDAVPITPEAPPEGERQLAALVAPRPGPDGGGPRNGVPNWLRHAAVAPAAHERPMIAVVVDDLGLNRRNTAALNELAGPLTLAFLPYAGELERQTRAARTAGHELLLHMPMEPLGTDWPGPDALLSSLGDAEFVSRMQKNFASFSGFVGLNNHMGSRLTADRGRMARIMEELRRRDLLFLDSKTTPGSVGLLEARSQGVPSVQRDVFLDNEIDLQHVLRQLRRTEQLATRRGYAIAIGHPHDVTIEALRRWLPTLAERGFVLVPISTIVARQACMEQLIAPACRALGAPDPLRAASAEGVPPS